MAHSQSESDRISKPFVSIGLPVFNSENSIKDAIESIINQTFHSNIPFNFNFIFKHSPHAISDVPCGFKYFSHAIPNIP